ncbi:hypothetical protein COEREDRAFT_7419 [Coemansia reversa NRRL 1564]|uniref:Uncharacterized protein n=1 Tax=Coemansia reversa (strain ATCC 12441 / NRRL 1564) TaxID=763665 RepID=A0A2G5BEL9_COERN|nr:hypothetical protein COEREDRAFT_7419 [Coemansia reversa NRRL 1564]|eukprot:PIA17460.1 hypothetical protein COEREDRAFT_7419 [Coemansia reversa NRRL 1564]
MTLELKGKRQRADLEEDDVQVAYASQSNSDNSNVNGNEVADDVARLGRSKRLRGADGTPWELQLPTPPSTTAEQLPQQACCYPGACEHYSHVGGDEWPHLHHYNQNFSSGASGEGCSPESPPHATGTGEEELWEDELDPASEYYSINRLLNQLHHEREQRRQQQPPQSHLGRQ